VATLIIDLKEATAVFLSFACHRSSDEDQNKKYVVARFVCKFRISDFVRNDPFRTAVFLVVKEAG
jgi:hypothetical protein